MTQTVKIPETEVTEDLIKYSMPGDCTACGIAITILENTGFFPVIWDDIVYLFKTQNGQYKFADLRHDDDKCEKVEEKPIQCFEVADDLSEWMNQFDSQPYTDPPRPIKIASTDDGELIIVDCREIGLKIFAEAIQFPLDYLPIRYQHSGWYTVTNHFCLTDGCEFRARKIGLGLDKLRQVVDRRLHS